MPLYLVQFQSKHERDTTNTRRWVERHARPIVEASGPPEAINIVDGSPNPDRRYRVLRLASDDAGRPIETRWEGYRVTDDRLKQVPTNGS